jgi:integrase
VEQWLPIAKPDVAPKTYNEYVRVFEMLCDEIGDKLVRDVKASSIKRVYSVCFAGLSASYIAHAKSAYTALFDSALADGLTISNPCRDKAAQPHKGTHGSHRAITEREREIIETMAVDHRMHAVAMAMLYAGLRPAEAGALSMDNVDMEGGVIYVRAYLRAKGSNQRIVSERMKTEKSLRQVPLFSPLKKALDGKEGLLITDKAGNVASWKSWKEAWKSYKHAIEAELNGISCRWYGKTNEQKAMKKAGTLPEWKTFDVVPYDLRHSFVTWCRDNGVELHTCVEWCGHTNASMILKIYDEVSDDRSKKEAERLEKIICDSRKEKKV